jgi:transcriptional regulator with XRE-family HTH domain
MARMQTDDKILLRLIEQIEKRRSSNPHLLGKKRSSTLRMGGTFGTITLHIEHRFTPRYARMIAVAFLRQMGPWYDYFFNPNLRDSRSWSRNFIRDEDRGVPLFKGVGLDQPRGRMGTLIRTKRLEKGWTLAKLAEETGLSLTHLSDLERGLHTPYFKTLKRLEAALGVSLADTGETIFMPLKRTTSLHPKTAQRWWRDWGERGWEERPRGWVKIWGPSRVWPPEAK